MTENTEPASQPIPAPPPSGPQAEGFFSPRVTLALAALSVPLAFLPYLLMRLEGLTAMQMRQAAMAGGVIWAAAVLAALLSGRQRRKLFLIFLLAPVALGPVLASEVKVFRHDRLSGLDLADYLAERGQHMGMAPKALDSYRLSLLLNPWKYLSYLKRGYTHLSMNSPDLALQDFETALRLAPQAGGPHIFMGKYYLWKGQIDLSLRHMDEAIRLDPLVNDYYRERARLYSFIGQPEKERADIDKALAVCPSCALGTLLDQGFFCLSTGKAREAADYYTRAAALPGAPAETYLNRASAYFSLKRYAEAAADCDKAVSLRPSVFGVYALRAEARLRLNQRDGSLEDYDRALKQRAGYEDYLQRAAANFYFKRYAAGRADAAKAVELCEVATPADSGLLSDRGWVYLWAGEWEKARADLEKAISMDPALPHPYGNLANYYWAAKKDKRKALEYLELEFQRDFAQWDGLTSELGDGYFLKGLNGTPEFKALVAKYRKTRLACSGEGGFSLLFTPMSFAAWAVASKHGILSSCVV